MKFNFTTRDIAIGAGFVAIYVALTYGLGWTSYGVLQFRISEMLMIFPFWHRRYIIPSIVGVAIANFYSPLGIIDIVVGVLIAIIAYTIIPLVKNKVIDVVLYALLCGLLVGYELTYVYHDPYWFTFLTVTASQLIICFIGYAVVRVIRSNQYIREIIFE